MIIVFLLMSMNKRVVGQFLVAGWLISAVVVSAAEVVFPAPPRLATTARELAEMRASADFGVKSNTAIQQAEALLKTPVVVPDGPAQWVFYYTNPKTGHWLKAKSPTEHVDPATGEIFTDERTLAAYRCILHDQANQAAVTLGWAYVYSGDDRFVGEVKRILLKLAGDYSKYPDRLDRWGHTGMLAPLGGRRYAQSLEEAVGVIKLAKAYDLTRSSSAWSDEERQKVEKDFFKPTADSLLRFSQGTSNHQTWFNAGLLCVASVLADKAMFEQVLNMRGGVYDQFDRSIGDDGLWYEGSMAYHRYALDALIEIADACRRVGLPLQDQPKLRSMFDGPRQIVYPNGQFPAINDSDRANLSLMAGELEWAARYYNNAAYTNAALVPTASANLASAGVAILRRNPGTNAVCAMMHYGPHNGEHSHFDKLNLMLYANGREWLLDPGRLIYSIPEYKSWAKTTAAHNTVWDPLESTCRHASLSIL